MKKNYYLVINNDDPIYLGTYSKKKEAIKDALSYIHNNLNYNATIEVIAIEKIMNTIFSKGEAYTFHEF